MGKLDGKIALVTGGYSGIGGASTELFAQEGAMVVFVGRSADKGYAYENKLRKKGLQVKFLPCDISNKKDLTEVKAYLELFYPRMVKGGIILIHDYFTEFYHGVKVAVDDFEKNYNIKLTRVPIGDGISIAIVCN